jgi:hypothetical protein
MDHEAAKWTKLTKRQFHEESGAMESLAHSVLRELRGVSRFRAPNHHLLE